MMSSQIYPIRIHEKSQDFICRSEQVKKCNFLPEGSGEELQKSLFNNFKEPLKEKKEEKIQEKPIWSVKNVKKFADTYR